MKKELNKQQFNRNGSIFLILAVVVCIALIVVVGVYKYTQDTDDDATIDQPTPTPTETAPTPTSTPSIDTSNWKTYTNEEYGYSIKYPGEAVITGYEESLSDEDYSKARKVQFANGDLVIRANVEDNLSNKSLNSWIKSKFADVVMLNDEMIEQKVFGTSPGASLELGHIYEPNQVVKYSFIQLKSGSIVSFYGSYSEDTKDEFMSSYESFIQSFRDISE